MGPVYVVDGLIKGMGSLRGPTPKNAPISLFILKAVYKKTVVVALMISAQISSFGTKKITDTACTTSGSGHHGL